MSHGQYHEYTLVKLLESICIMRILSNSLQFRLFVDFFKMIICGYVVDEFGRRRYSYNTNNAEINKLTKSKHQKHVALRLPLAHSSL